MGGCSCRICSLIVCCVVVALGLILGWTFGANELSRFHEELLEAVEEAKKTPTTPEAVHIAYGDNPTQMLITWSTAAPYENYNHGRYQHHQTIPVLSSHSFIMYDYAFDSEGLELDNRTTLRFKQVAVDIQFVKLNPEGKQWLHKARLTVCFV